MLTDPSLIAHRDAGRLVVWRPNPLLPLLGRRTILMVPEVYEEVNVRPWPKVAGETPQQSNNRRRQMQAILGAFVHGNAMVPREHVKALKRKDPTFNDLMSIRASPPYPQGRLIGQMFCETVLIGTGFFRRDETKTSENEEDFEVWRKIALIAQDRYANLFPDRPPRRIPYPLDSKHLMKIYLDGQ